jgi:hypothetical protein
MQTIWEMMFTGMGVVMTTATIAVFVGLCVVIWCSRRID